ncbi:putative The fantastic four family protein [Helianthus anomalus]
MQGSDLGDHIGMESCVDLESDSESAVFSSQAVNRKAWGRRSERKGKEVEELPPCCVRVLMKRYYTDDGRLVITEEKINTPPFTSHRSHGRLTLQLKS